MIVLFTMPCSKNNGTNLVVQLKSECSLQTTTGMLCTTAPVPRTLRSTMLWYGDSNERDLPRPRCTTNVKAPCTRAKPTPLCCTAVLALDKLISLSKSNFRAYFQKYKPHSKPIKIMLYCGQRTFENNWARSSLILLVQRLAGIRPYAGHST